MLTFGVFPQVDIPETIVFQFDEETAMEMVDGAAQTDLNGFAIFGTALNALLTSLKSILFVYALLICIGVPPVIAIPIQTIIYAVYVWDIVLFIFNRQKPAN